MPDPLAALRGDLSGLLVALDFDGTLAPITLRPEQTVAAEGLHDLLVRLAPRVRRLALISGRPVLSVVEMTGLQGVSDIVALGHYGLERWEGGVLTAPEPDPELTVVRRELPALLPPGTHVEDKTHSLVVHTRQAPDPAATFAALAEPLASLAAAHGLECLAGRYAWELRPPGIDKGSALKSLAAQAMPRAVLVCGDDLGDLPMFTSATELGVPAVRIAVVTRDAPPQVAAAADVVVDGPEALVALLKTL